MMCRHSLEQEVRQILTEVVDETISSKGIGTRMAEFDGFGLDDRIEQLPKDERKACG